LPALFINFKIEFLKNTIYGYMFTNYHNIYYKFVRGECQYRIEIVKKIFYNIHKYCVRQLDLLSGNKQRRKIK